MTTTHSIVGELLSADLELKHGLPTITLQLRQRSNAYSGQRITAVRSYPGTLAAARLASDHHAALRCGALYRVAADAIGIGQATGVVYLLGVRDAREVQTEPRPYPIHPHEPNALAAEGACRGLAMSLPAALQRVRVQGAEA